MERCEDCKFYYKFKSGVFCRRNPPQVQISAEPDPLNMQIRTLTRAYFPAVDKDFWCGEFEPDLMVKNN